jgi:hypothetical protein
VVEALLAVTDNMATALERSAIVKASTRRCAARADIAAALPNLGAMVQKYARPLQATDHRPGPTTACPRNT